MQRAYALSDHLDGALLLLEEDGGGGGGGDRVQLRLASWNEGSMGIISATSSALA